MSYSTFIAFRYLKSKRKIASVSIISFISLVGVIVGTAALVVVISVFNGFQGLVTNILVNFDPHIRITAQAGEYISEPEKVLAQVESIHEVKSATMFLSGKAMAVSGGINRAVNITGIVPPSNAEISSLSSSVVLGQFLDPNRNNQILIGISLADALDSVVGDTIAIISPAGIERSLTQFYQPKVAKFVVSGIYQSKNKDYDGYYAFINLPAAQDLFTAPGERLSTSMVNGIDIRLWNIENSNEIKKRLEQMLSDVRIDTWYDLHKDLYQMMTMERIVAYIVLSLIIIVAAFNILGSLTMTVIEKRREIGALKSMGATQRGIMGIYLIEGTCIGLFGSAIGLFLGFLVDEAQIRYHLFKLDTSVYIIPALPVSMHTADFIIVGLIAIVISSVAALYPAKRAAKINPAEAVRWE
ncbi:MAG TPA: ABC transporter permease [Candidatus Acidoferrales bacterium]|nr:ABC transporter permease [Candidatus Acidoferrales bacterium]